MKIGKSDCLGFAVLCTMIALKTVFVRHVMGITYEIAGLVPSLLIVGAKIRKFSDIGIKKNLQNLNRDKIGAALFYIQTIAIIVYSFGKCWNVSSGGRVKAKFGGYVME